MSAVVKTIGFHDGASLEIFQDEDPTSPREWDNLGHIVCFHKRYILGDKHEYRETDFSGWDELRKRIEKDNDVLVILPLFLYDHSGISISTSATYPYNCPWDAGQVGFIFVTVDEAKAWYEVDEVTGEFRQRVRENLLTEVKEYNQYLTGDMYGFVLKVPKPSCESCGHTEYEEDSCCGFLGCDIAENGMLDHISTRYHEEIEKAID